MSPFSFLFLVTNTPWVYALAEALGKEYLTHATRFYDWPNYRRLRPTWANQAPSLVWRSLRVLPPGYVGSLKFLFNPYLQWQIQQWCQQLQVESGTYPWTLVPYPFSASWVRHLPPERLIYYNLDEYIHYQPQRKEEILDQEAELVDRATLTLCIAQFQVETLRQRYPHRSASIRHFPLGVVNTFINPDPTRSPKPMTVGYIGNLIDRVDWKLVQQVAQACPEVTFVFVGGLDGFAGDTRPVTWKAERAAALALPNIRHIEKVPQKDVSRYYWSFALNWIPYDIHHPFNQASCPTKVMDGIASCRPVVSTDIPECRLYPQWVTIFYSVDEAISLIRRELSCQEPSIARHKSLQQHNFVSQQTWESRASSLVSLLDEVK
jgi:teichuronic acid biosynthesis glycosyltransferase TuaH